MAILVSACSQESQVDGRELTPEEQAYLEAVVEIEAGFDETVTDFVGRITPPSCASSTSNTRLPLQSPRPM